MQWETVIGLEVHVQLATRSKIFSSASTEFGAAPNTQASGLDIALPGTLPVLNEAAVRMAVTFGVAIGAHISTRCVFDRKNYFYPDLPKGYQISQFESPIVGAGNVDIRLDDGSIRTIRITRAHLEEDAGKSLHEDFAGMTGIDLNRAGMPLLEIVSEPDLRNAKEAAAYFRQMHTLVRYIGICDGNLNEGSMRCDANVSVRPAGTNELGVRTEIKNLNSFRFLEHAIDHEVARQIEVIEGGGRVRRETRLYDPDRDETRTMRTKELSDDYRYFPEPDLLPVVIDEAFIAEVRGSLPELPQQKRNRYMNELALSDYDASRLTDDPSVARFFESVLSVSGEAKAAANWILGDWSATLNRIRTASRRERGNGRAARHADRAGNGRYDYRKGCQVAVRDAVESRRSEAQRRRPDQRARARAGLRFRRTRGGHSQDRRREPRAGRTVPRRQREGTRLLRRSDHEGDAGSCESPTNQFAAPRSALRRLTLLPFIAFTERFTNARTRSRGRSDLWI